MPASVTPRHQILKSSGAAITASGSSAALANLSHQVAQSALAFLSISGSVTGTTPSITVKFQGSPDGTNWADIPSGAFAAQTAATAANTAVRLPLAGLLDPFIRAVWTVTGTTPSFGGVELDLIFVNQNA